MKKPNYLVYPAVFDNVDNDGFYTVTFPDVPDTVSQGETLEEAVQNAPDALAVALPDYASYPKPTPLEQVRANNPGLLVSLVGVDMHDARREISEAIVHENVTIPKSLAEEAKVTGINFSETLTEALEAKLGM
ncbi:type II toxin-antitoxin system HicB family antitoxin [Lacticaseibacillus songhuajiangensis]|jgi:predicted RNase H-like HicB family nuclease|uniref:type II toxin-antitoxin system HicB family antitoxin n=1 Tax=Lacticaseibacillus songhuajiangensis TaxID=1296539 RepID=UPI000F76C894|nr:type II toxin-antitoxin system HicB family antitoxin [Lacticaseibacillus songhuajiangensis]